MSRCEKKLKGKMDDEIKLAGRVGAVGACEALDAQLKSLGNFRGRALGDRDVSGGEIWFKNS